MARWIDQSRKMITMDCRTALEILEVARPGSGDLTDPELAKAAAHIESHAECQQEFLRRQQLDREIGAAMRDVPMPHDLSTRLLAELAKRSDSTDAAEVVETVAVAVTSAEPNTALRRRTWMRWVVGAAACIAVVIGLQFLPGDPELIDITELPNQVANSIGDQNLDLNFDKLKEFDGSYAHELQRDWNSPLNELPLIGPKSYQYQDADGANLAIAMYQFRFKHRNVPVTGYLLVLPARLVKQDQRPANKFLAISSAVIGPRMTSQSWIRGDFVYICVVPSGHKNFEELVNQLSGRIM
jgi:hypothetical protein